MRKRLERKLQIAEDSLKRLDQALRRSGVKLDVDVFADVKTLLAFFEERYVLSWFLKMGSCAVTHCIIDSAEWRRCDATRSALTS